MKQLACLLIAALVAGQAWAALDVRHYYLTNDVSAASVAVSPLKWQQGESVKVDLYTRRGTVAVDLTGVTTVRMETTHPTNLTQLYMCETGTIANATNGYVTFDISPANANLPTSNLYTAYVRCYQYTNSENRYVGDIYKGPVYVLFGPSATNIIWRGPYTNAVESDPVYSAWSLTNTWLIQAASTAQGYVNGASNNVLALAASDATSKANVAKTNDHNLYVTWGNSTDTTARATANVALTNAHNEFTPWGYATDTTARADAAIAATNLQANLNAVSNNAMAAATVASTNAHDTLLDLAGTRQLSGDLSETPTTWKIRHSNQQDVITFVHTPVQVLGPLYTTNTDATLNLKSANLAAGVMTNVAKIYGNGAGYVDPYTATMYGSTGSRYFEGNDRFNIYAQDGTQILTAPGDITISTNLSVTGFGVISGNGSGLTDLQYAASAGVAAFATNVPFWSGVGSFLVSESADHKTSIVYHVTTIFNTNKLGEFYSTP